jgi:hypothetical protein
MRLRHMLVITQVAVSLVLLVAASLFAPSLIKLQRIVGFNPESILLLDVTPAGRRRPSTSKGGGLSIAPARARDHRSGSGGDASVSGLFSRAWRNAIDIEGFVPPPGVTLRSFANAVSPDYFE